MRISRRINPFIFKCCGRIFSRRCSQFSVSLSLSLRNGNLPQSVSIVNLIDLSSSISWGRPQTNQSGGSIIPTQTGRQAVAFSVVCHLANLKAANFRAYRPGFNKFV
ncbi:hypothetical protein CEXT_699351 [Caerostris extrusa]|uniref:Uncharacterized protein n=1 Tax=Caerostris extrusa TaxID=172846 RepID=A0AAV4NR70_CAEEX|nr:hypothetical protein CEXT_699351 [Caerostris extrusa]